MFFFSEFYVRTTSVNYTTKNLKDSDYKMAHLNNDAVQKHG